MLGAFQLGVQDVLGQVLREASSESSGIDGDEDLAPEAEHAFLIHSDRTY